MRPFACGRMARILLVKVRCKMLLYIYERNRITNKEKDTSYRGIVFDGVLCTCNGFDFSVRDTHKSKQSNLVIATRKRGVATSN